MGRYSAAPPGEGSTVAVELAQAPTSGLATPSGVSAAQRADIAEKWLTEARVGSVHTEARYRRDIACFFQWADHCGYDVFALLPWQMSEYADALKRGEYGDLKASTRAGRINAVSAFYRFVARQARGFVLPNPAAYVKRPRAERRSPTRKLTADELTALRNEARSRNVQLYALVQLLVGSGIRISEALGADVSHLRREGAEWYLYVQRKGYEDRTPVQVPVEAVRALHRHLRGRRGPLFLDRAGQRMSRRAAASQIRYAALKAGIRDRNVSPHSLRHTATTLALDAGVPIRDVQVQMGHASPETTARYDRDNRERNNPTVLALGRLIADDLQDEALDSPSATIYVPEPFNVRPDTDKDVHLR